MTDAKRVDCRHPCDKCGYDLRSGRLDGCCPECGHAIRESLVDPRITSWGLNDLQLASRDPTQSGVSWVSVILAIVVAFLLGFGVLLLRIVPFL